MDTSELIQRIKAELIQELREEMKEMLLREMDKSGTRKGATTTISISNEANGLDSGLDALAQVLESSVSRVRSDLLQLTRKLDALEPGFTAAGTSIMTDPTPSTHKTSLPSLFHRSIPPPLLLETCPISPKTLATSAKQVTLPVRRDYRRYSNAGCARSASGDAGDGTNTESEMSMFERRVYSARERKPTSGLLELSDSGGLDLSDDDSYYEEDTSTKETMSDSALQMSMSSMFDNDDEVITLNVGGRMFQTYRQTILRHPESLLSQYVSSHCFSREASNTNKHREPFFDRNSTAFEAVLDFYRTGQLLKPPELHEDIWKQEVAFWNVKEAEELKEKKKRRSVVTKRKKKKKSGSHIREIRRIDAALEPLTLPIRSWEDADVLHADDKNALLSPGDKLTAVSRGKPSSLKDIASFKSKDKKEKEEKLTSLSHSSSSLTEMPTSARKKDKSKTSSVPADMESSGGEWKKKRRSQSLTPSDVKREKEKAEKAEKKDKVKRSDSNRSLS